MEKLISKTLIEQGWKNIPSQEAIEYFTREFTNKFSNEIEGILVLSKASDINFTENSAIRIDRYTFGSLHVYPIYAGKCYTIEDFNYLNKLLNIK